MSKLKANGSAAPPALVVPYPRRLGASAHDIASHRSLAGKLATVLGCPCVLDYEPGGDARPGRERIYYVPAMTLGAPAAERLGIGNEADLYGGVVPYEFVATKAISHPVLERAHAAPPPGWEARLGERLRGCVLQGYTVFSCQDALRAGALLLRDGPVRIKPVHATAGRGQLTAHDEADLRAAVRSLDESEFAQCGLVLEEHLEDVDTYSVGVARLPGLCASYVGTQRLTRDNQGAAVYGGSDMIFVRGDLDVLAARHWPAALRHAIGLAMQYDRAIELSYPGFYASRRNYDVAGGRNAQGQYRYGVLEQSWRAGGASMGEACALEAFAADAGLTRVRARTTESYGEGSGEPADALLIYDDDDPFVGRIRKSAGVVRHGHE